MKVIVVKIDCVINGTFYRKGEVVQVEDSYENEEVVKEIVKEKADEPTQ